MLAAAPTALRFVTPSRTSAVAGCSEAVTVEATDAFGNPSAVGAPVTLAASSTPSGLDVFTDAACTQGATAAGLSATTATLHFQGQVAGDFELQLSDAAGLGSVTQRQTVSP